jgi:hypothetical protein
VIIEPDSQARPGVRCVILTHADADGVASDVTTCPRCRVAVLLGQACSCPMRWTGGSERPTPERPALRVG